MSSEAEIRTLISEVQKGGNVLRKIASFYDAYLSRTSDVRDRTPEQAIVLAEVFVSYYTCLETIFLRISQFFENALAPDKWHQDLLHKMTLRIEGVREPVVSDSTAALLSELLKFRHFKRYYFELDYDWDRLDFVRKKFDRARAEVSAELEGFLGFLRGILPSSSDSPRPP
jgi:hypothetical protein